MMLRPQTLRSFVFWGVVSAAAPAAAQNGPVPTPFAGLFGGQVRQRTQSLTASGSLFGVYQEVLLPPGQEAALRETDSRFQKGGAYGGASGSLNYSYDRRTENSSFFLGGQSSLSTYSIDLSKPQYTYGASAGLSTRLTRRIDFSSTLAGAYSPFYNFAPFQDSTGSLSTLPGVAALGRPEFGFAATASANVNTSVSVGVTGSLSSRTSAYSTLAWRRTYFIDAPDNDYWAIDGRVGLSHRLTRQLGFHVGWAQSVSHYVRDKGATSPGTQGPDFGVDFGDSGTFRLTRRTTASLAVAATSTYYSGSTRYALTGNASIAYSISRSWSASAGYGRNFGFSALFEQPVLTDSVNGTIGGRVAPRVSWTSSGGWSRGKFSDSDSHYTTYSATTGLQFAIVRMLSAYAQYGYYRYTVPPGSTTLGILSMFSRQTVSVGLSTSVPIFNSVRAH